MTSGALTLAEQIPDNILIRIIGLALPMMHGTDLPDAQECFNGTDAVLIVVHGQALQGRHGCLGSVRQILIEAGEPLLEIGGAGNQLFDIVKQGRRVCDDDLGVIKVLVERSQGGGFRRAEEAIGHGHRGDLRDRPGNVVVKEDQRVGGTFKGAKVEHNVRLPFEDEFPEHHVIGSTPVFER
jgi:hypothetical protein